MSSHSHDIHKISLQCEFDGPAGGICGGINSHGLATHEASPSVNSVTQLQVGDLSETSPTARTFVSLLLSYMSSLTGCQGRCPEESYPTFVTDRSLACVCYLVLPKAELPLKTSPHWVCASGFSGDWLPSCLSGCSRLAFLNWLPLYTFSLWAILHLALPEPCVRVEPM